MRCGNCGTENRAGAKYCTSCGEPLVSTMKKRRSPLHIILPVVLVVIGLSVFFLLRSLNGVTTLADMERINGGEMPSFLFNEDEALQFVRGKFTEKGIEDADTAREAASELYRSFGVDCASENLELLREDVAFENHFYRFQQKCQGIPVYQHEIVLCADAAGSVSALNGFYWEGSVDTVSPKVQSADLEVEDSAADYRSEAQLVILAHTATEGELAWQFTTPTQGYVYSAETGDLLRREELVTSEMRRTRSASGNVEFDANYENGFYIAEDTSRNIVVIDAKNQDPIDEQQCELHGFSEGAWDREDIALALANVERAYDEYCKLGREGYDGKKSRIRVFVQKGERTGGNTNAGSNPGGLIEYNADNSISLACTLHEYSHMVQRSICSMNYDGSDRDAIMEAYADIMAICILEEDSWQYDGNCRNIANPLDLTTGEQGPHATSYLETDESKGAWIAGDGHRNSTAISHAAYLMYESGFSFEKLRKLWYLSMYFLDSYANARTCRAAVLSAATLMNCSGSEVQIIEDAFDSVGIDSEGYGLNQSAKIVALNNDRSLHEGFDLTITSVDAARAGTIFSAPKSGRAVWTASTSDSSVRLDSLDDNNEKLPDGLYLMTLRDNTETRVCATKCIQISSEAGKDSAEVMLATEPKVTVEITKIPGKIRNYQNENTVEETTKEEGDRDAAVNFINEWYDDWVFVDGHEKLNGDSLLARCPPLIAEDSELFDEFVRSCTDLDGEYSREVATCVISTPEAKELGDGTFRVTVRYLVTQNSVDQAMYDRLLADPHEDVWDVVVNEDDKLTSLELVSRDEEQVDREQIEIVSEEPVPSMVSQSVTYTLRYDLNGLKSQGGTGDIGGVYVPGTIAEWRSYYGDDSIEVDLYSGYIAGKGTIPNTDLTVEYLNGENEGATEAISIEGRLDEMVDGLGSVADSGISLYELGLHLQSKAGAFSVRDLIPSYLFKESNMCGLCYMDANQDWLLHFADGDNMARLLHSMNDGGLIYPSTRINISTLDGIYQ